MASAAQTVLPHTMRLQSGKGLHADKGITVGYPDGWSLGQPSLNSWVLLNVPADKQQTVEPTVRVAIGYLERPNHAEAVGQLLEYANESRVSSRFLAIGWWPALQRVQVVKKRQPGGADEQGEPSQGVPTEEIQYPDVKIIQITTAIAAGNLLIRLEGVLPEDASQQLQDLVLSVGRSLVFTSTGDPATVEQDLNRLNSTPRRPAIPQGAAALPKSGANLMAAPLLAASTPVFSLQQLNNGTNGELEVAVSNNGTNIVVVKQSGWITSNDGGQTFNSSGNLNVSDGDSSIAFGQSGNFYHAALSCFGSTCQPPCPGASPTGTPPSTNTCVVVAPSTDNGQTFPAPVSAAVCPNSGANACSLDQEHIAADRVNAGGGGKDLVYAAVRDCQGGCGTKGAFVTCSPDSGATWAPLFNMEVGSDFPRVAVGKDGLFYVVYELGGNIRIDKFNGCTTSAAQMTRAAGGFPVTVAGYNSFTGCEVANGFGGLDRCNDGNTLSGPTVTVDDTNGNHVYVAWANNTSANNESVQVADSTNGGVNWRAPVTINTNVTARRFHPWACATGGNAYVGWYDRRAATAGNNDLTDYFAASAGLSAGNLIANNDEFKISANSDAQCNVWPRAPRSTWDSENCSVQPQLAGICKVTPPQIPDPSTNNRCDFSGSGGNVCGTNPTTNTAETCSTGNGAVKYGDYNGNACTSGRLYSVFASSAGLGQVNDFFQSFVVSSTPTTVTYTGPTTGAYLQAVTLSAVLSLSGSSAGIAGQTIAFSLGTQSCSGVTNASGFTSCPLTLNQLPALYTVTASFAGSGNYQASSASLPFTITKAPTTVTYNGAITGAYHNAVTLSGVLIVNATSAPLPGQTLTFSIGTQSCAGVTDGSGFASCPVTLNQIPGPYLVTASFAGTAYYMASSASTAFTITKAETILSYTGPLDLQDGGKAKLSGVLREKATAVPISGRQVMFVLGSGATTQSCTGTTNAAGIAACTISVVAQPRGLGLVEDVFAGDAYYLPSNASAITMVTGFPDAVRLSVNPNPATPGQSVKLLAKVALGPGLPKPPLPDTATGSVTFYDLLTPIGTVPLDATAVATLDVTFTAGVHLISVKYSGDTIFIPSQATVKLVVQ